MGRAGSKCRGCEGKSCSCRLVSPHSWFELLKSQISWERGSCENCRMNLGLSEVSPICSFKNRQRG